MTSSKNAFVHVAPELLAAVESILGRGESVNSFVNWAVAVGVERRKAQLEVLAKVLARREEARAIGAYVDAKEVVAKLEVTLAKALERRR